MEHSSYLYGTFDGICVFATYTIYSMSNRKMKVVMVKEPRQKPRKQNMSARRGSATDIPAFFPRLKATNTFRYYNGASQSVNVSQNFLMTQGMGCIATGTNILYPMAGTVRVRRVTIWGPIGAQGNVSSVVIYWRGNTGILSPSEHEDITMNPNVPAYLSARPPKGSFAGQWFQAGTAVNLFTLVLPTSAVVDIELESQQRQSSDTSISIATVSGATIGNVYHPSFNANLVPQGVDTIL